MSAVEILEKINQLSAAEKLFIIEKTFKDLLHSNSIQQMTLASESMENEYRTNKELTSFTNIDFENFYEAK
jgi:hypothetical protein